MVKKLNDFFKKLKLARKKDMKQFRYKENVYKKEQINKNGLCGYVKVKEEIKKKPKKVEMKKKPKKVETKKKVKTVEQPKK